MAMLVRSLGRNCLLRQKLSLTNYNVAQASSAYDEMRGFWEKNRKLKRPMSPFLFAYKPHLAMSMSLSHRVTGVAMSVAVTGASIIMLALPGDYTHYLELVKNLELGPIIICGTKFVLAWPIAYHYINGFRHLAWDAGKGYALTTLYKTGYFTIALSFIVAAMFVFLY